MEPITAVAIGVTIVAGTTLIARIASLLRGDERERQIKQRAKHARKRMDQTSQKYLRDVDHILRRR